MRRDWTEQALLSEKARACGAREVQRPATAGQGSPWSGLKALEWAV